VLNIAVRDGKISSNPVCKLKMFKESAGKTRFLSVEEEKHLMAALGPKYAPWARLAILTGLRQKEQFSLRWKDVDLERGIIALPTTKAGCVQYVPLNEEAKQILQSLTSWEKSVWVFPSENKATHLDPLNFYHRIWMTAVANSKIEWCTWHDLRHTFASRLAMNGAAEGTIAALLRHSTTALVRRYAHLSPSHLKAALESVASFGRSTTTNEKDSQDLISNPTVTETGIDGLCHQLEER
jgi:integrase